jgi:hypothetical protein
VAILTAGPRLAMKFCTSIMAEFRACITIRMIANGIVYVKLLVEEIRRSMKLLSYRTMDAAQAGRRVLRLLDVTKRQFH